MEKRIEAILGSPPERDELVVQLFCRDGGQWGEMYRDGETFWLELYGCDTRPIRFTVDELIEVLSLSQTELRHRLEQR